MKNKILKFVLRSILTLFFASVSFVVFSNDVFAVDRYWVGNDAGCNGQWTTSSCWSSVNGGTGGASVPDDSTYNVYFTSHARSQRTCYLNTGSNTQIGNLNISGYAGYFLYLESPLDIAQNLSINSGYIQALNSSGVMTVSGNMTVSGGFLRFNNYGAIGVPNGSTTFSSGDIRARTGSIFNAFSMSGGTFTSYGTGTVLIKNNFSQSGGVFTVGSGTVEIGTSGQAYTYDLSGGQMHLTDGYLLVYGPSTIRNTAVLKTTLSNAWAVFNNTLTVYNSGTVDYSVGENRIIANALSVNTSATFEMGVDSIMDVQGNLSVLGGSSASFGGHTVTVYGNTSFTGTGTTVFMNTGTTNLYGNLSISSAVDFYPGLSGTRKVVLRGDSSSTINVASVRNLYALDINKTYSNNQVRVITNNLSVDNDLNVISGYFLLGYSGDPKDLRVGRDFNLMGNNTTFTSFLSKVDVLGDFFIDVFAINNIDLSASLEVSVGGYLIALSGDLNMSSYTTYISQGLTLMGTNLRVFHNMGNVIFNSNKTGYIRAVKKPLYNVFVDKSGGSLTFVDSLLVNNNFRLNKGTVYTEDYYLQTGGKFIIDTGLFDNSGVASIYVGGSILVYGGELIIGSGEGQAGYFAQTGGITRFAYTFSSSDVFKVLNNFEISSGAFWHYRNTFEILGNMNVSGNGRYWGNSTGANLILRGAFYLSSTTIFEAPKGVFSYFGNYFKIYSGASFSSSGGRIQFVRENNSGSVELDVPGNVTFHDLWIALSGTSDSFLLGMNTSVVNITGQLYLSSGVFANASGYFNLIGDSLGNGQFLVSEGWKPAFHNVRVEITGTNNISGQFWNGARVPRLILNNPNANLNTNCSMSESLDPVVFNRQVDIMAGEILFSKCGMATQSRGISFNQALNISGGAFGVSDTDLVGLTFNGSVNITGGSLFDTYGDTSFMSSLVINGGTVSFGSGDRYFYSFVNMHSGTFNGGSGLAEFLGVFNMSGGTFNSGTANYYFSNTLSLNSYVSGYANNGVMNFSSANSLNLDSLIMGYSTTSTGSFTAPPTGKVFTLRKDLSLSGNTEFIPSTSTLIIQGGNFSTNSIISGNKTIPLFMFTVNKPNGSNLEVNNRVSISRQLNYLDSSCSGGSEVNALVLDNLRSSINYSSNADGGSCYIVLAGGGGVFGDMIFDVESKSSLPNIVIDSVYSKMYSPLDGSYQLDGNLIVRNGEFRGSNSNISIYGRIIQTGGTFSAQTSSFEFLGSGESSISSTSIDFNNLSINKDTDSAYLEIVNGSLVNVNGALSLARGKTAINNNAELSANNLMTWSSTFNGALNDADYKGYLRIKTTHDVTIPVRNAGLDALVPSLKLDATNRGATLYLYTGSSTTVPLVFFGNLEIVSSALNSTWFVNQNRGEIFFNSDIIVRAGSFIAMHGGVSVNQSVVFNSDVYVYDGNFQMANNNTVAQSKTAEFNGEVNVLGGIFYAGPFTPGLFRQSTFNGPVNVTGGTFNSSYSSLTFNDDVVANSTFNLTIANSVDFSVNSTFYIGANVNASTAGYLNFDNPNTSISHSAGTFTAPATTMTIAGNYTKTGGTFTHNNGTVTFDGSTNSILNTGNITFSKLHINKDISSSLTFSSGVLTVLDRLRNISGIFDVSSSTLNLVDLWISGGELIAPSAIMNVSGDFTYSSGTFTHNNGTVVLNGTDQSISNDILLTFYNLTKTLSSSSQTLGFDMYDTVRVLNNAVLKGASASERLLLRSLEPSYQWYFDPQGTRDFEYLDVQDGNNVNINTIMLGGTGSVDSGNNTNWSFGPKYWVGADGASWNDVNNWASSSGGVGGAGVPLYGDTVYFDNSSNDCVVPNSFNVAVNTVFVESSYTGEIRGGDGSFSVSAFNQSGGTFTSGSKSFSTTSLSQSGGSFAGGSDVSISYLTVTAGDFYAGTDTEISFAEVYINSVNGQTNNGVVDFSDVLTVQVYYDFQIGRSGSSGSFTAPGVLQVFELYKAGNTGYFHNNGTVEFLGFSASFYSGNAVFYNVIFSKIGSLPPFFIPETLSVFGDLVVENNLIFNSGAVDLNAGNHLYVAGDVESILGFAGITMDSTSFLYLNGENQSFIGSHTFTNLFKEAKVSETLTFEAGERVVVSGALTLKGDSSLVTVLSLRSSQDGVLAEIDPQGTRTIAYLDVKDNKNVNSAPIMASGTNSIDSGNNINWDFGNRYWVGSNISWNSTAGWATSSGGPSGASVPNFSHNVYFDGNSGRANIPNGFGIDINSIELKSDFASAIYGESTGEEFYVTEAFKLYGGTFYAWNMIMALQGEYLQGGGAFDGGDNVHYFYSVDVHGGSFYGGEGASINVNDSIYLNNRSGEANNATMDFSNNTAVNVANDVLMGRTGSSGEMITPFSNFNINRNLTISSDGATSLTATNGSVNFVGSANSALSLGTPVDFNNLKINKSAGKTVDLESSDITVLNNLELVSGILEMTDSAISTKNLIQSGGEIIAPSSIFGIDGNFVKTGGTFTHNSGTIAFYGNTSAVFETTDITLFNLTINRSATLTLENSTKYTIENRLSILNGTLDATDSTIGINSLQSDAYFQSGGTFIAPSTNMSVLGGGFIKTGGIFTHSNGTLEFGISSNVTLEAPNTTFYNLVSAKTSTGSLTLAVGEISVLNSLELMSGFLDASDATLNVGAMFNQSGGAFDAPLGKVFTLNGNFIKTAGTFNHSASTLKIAGSGNSLIDVDATLELNNLSIEKSNNIAYLEIASGDIVNVNGNLALVTGRLAIRNTAELSANQTISWGAGFNGAYPNQDFKGYLQIKTTHNLTLPVFNAGLDKLLPSIKLDSSNRGTTLIFDVGNNSLTTFFGNLHLAVGSSYTSRLANTSSGSIVFNSDVVMDAGTFYPLYGPSTAYAYAEFNGDVYFNAGSFNLIYQSSSVRKDLTFNGNVFNNGANINLSTTTGFPTTAIFNGNYTQSSGNFYARISHIYVNSTFSASGGTIYFNYAHSVTFNEGSFFTGTGASIYATTAQSWTFYNANLYHSLGAFNAPSGVLTFNGTSSFERTGGGSFSANNGTVLFNGDGDSTIITGTNTVFANLVIDKPSAYKAIHSSGLLGISNSLNLQAGIFDASAGTINITSTQAFALDLDGGTFKAPSGNLTINGGITKESSAVFDHNNGTVILAGNANASIDIPDITFYNLSNSKGSSYTFTVLSGVVNVLNKLSITAGTLDFSGAELNINSSQSDAFRQSGGTFVAPSGNMYLSGGFDKTSGTFTHNNGTLVLNGTNQVIKHNLSLTLYNFVKELSLSADSLTFNNSQALVVLNEATLKGVSTNDRLALRSSTDGNFWFFDPQAVRNFEYLDVKDGNNVNASTIMLSGTGSFNSGNNVNWDFGERFWVGSSLNCNELFSDSDCWSYESGGIGGALVPSVNDVIYFDSSDVSNSYWDISVNVAGVRIEPGYTGTIDILNQNPVEVGDQLFLQRDGTFRLLGADILNIGFYLYGGTFEMGNGEFVSDYFFFNYFSPAVAVGNFVNASEFIVNNDFIFGSNTMISAGTFNSPAKIRVGGNVYSYSGNNTVFNNNDGDFIMLGSDPAVFASADTNLKLHNFILEKDLLATTVDATSDIYVEGDFYVYSGTFVLNENKKLYLSGDFLETGAIGTFTAQNNSETVLNGAMQTIFGSNTFSKLTKIVSNADTLFFEAGKASSVTGTLTLKGVSTGLLSLRSTIDATRSYIYPSGTRDVEYVDVKDNHNANITMISPLNSVDSGNNINWDFGKRYWVGANGASWNNTSSWSTASGGASGATVPSSIHDVYFDQGSNNASIPSSYNFDIKSLTVAPTYTGTITGGDGEANLGDVLISGGYFDMNEMMISANSYRQSAGVVNSGTRSFEVGGNADFVGGSFESRMGNVSIFGNLNVNSLSGFSNNAGVNFMNTSNVYVFGDLNLGRTSSTGALTAPYTLLLHGNISFAGDTLFMALSNRIILDGNQSRTINTNGQELYDFGVATIKNSGVSPTIEIQSTLYVLNTIYLDDRLDSGGVISTNSGVDIYVGKDLVDETNGEINFSGLNANTVLYLNGLNQIIAGNFVFPNLQKIVNVSDTLTFESGKRITILGTMVLKGASNSSMLALRAFTDGVQSEIDPQGTRDIAYLNVKDNYNVNVDPIIAIGPTFVNAGNNDGWVFSVAVSSYVDAFSTFNFRLFTGAYRGAMILYEMLAPFTNSWILSDDTLSNAGRIRSSIVYNGALYLGASDGKIYKRSDEGMSLRSSEYASNGQYSFISMVYDSLLLNDNLKLYIDGVLDTGNDFSVSLDSNNRALLLGSSYGSTVGGDNSSGEEFFKGKIDEFRISNQSFEENYLSTVYNNLDDPYGFISFGQEEQYLGQETGGELPSMTDKKETLIKGEIGPGEMWITAHGAFEDGVFLEGGAVSMNDRVSKWYYDEEFDYITFKDSASPDGFRLDLYLSSEDFGNFVYTGSNLLQSNIPAENFVVAGNYDIETGNYTAPIKGVDDVFATLNIDSSESCSDAFNMDSYIFHDDLISDNFSMSLSGVAKTYLRSNVPCVVKGTVDIRAMQLLIPAGCAEGDYSSTLYFLMVNG